MDLSWCNVIAEALLGPSPMLGKQQLPGCKLMIAIGPLSSPVNQGGPCLGKMQPRKKV